MAAAVVVVAEAAAPAAVAAAALAPAAADSRRKLRPGQHRAQPPLGRLLQLLGPPRSLVLVLRQVLALRLVLVPLRQPLGPQRVPLPLAPRLAR